MGSRTLKRWMALPLKDKAPIDQRLDCVDHFLRNTELAGAIHDRISQIGDLERIISKVATGRISPKETAQLKRALSAIGPIRDVLEKTGVESLHTIAKELHPCLEVIDRLEKELHADPPFLLGKGNVIAPGVDPELDMLRSIAFSGKDFLLQIQQRESERTGIPSLKIAFNNVFGYYLEVTNLHKNKVPPEWMRKQTLANAERYITPELKEYEDKILGAEEKILNLETRRFQDLLGLQISLFQFS
jgi:DNA mismatch repair protein MutS